MEILENDGAPVNGTDEVQTLTMVGSPTGGTFRVVVAGGQTAPIAHDATATAVQNALRAVSSVGALGATCTGGPLGTGAVTVTFGGRLGKKDVPLMVVRQSTLAGGTSPHVTVAVTTPGVDATFRTARPGQLLIDTTNKNLYINQGTLYAPDWAELALAG